MTDEGKPIAQVRITHEGDFINAYLVNVAMGDGESLLIASVIQGAYANEDLRKRFVDLASEFARWAIEKATGVEVVAELRKSEHGRDG